MMAGLRAARRADRGPARRPGESQAGEGGAWRVRERASGLLRRPGYVLCRQSEGGWTHLPADLHRHLCQGGLCQALRDRGSEYCGNPERHEYELYLAIEDIDHSRTKPRACRPICEQFYKTVLNEFYRVALRKKVYRSIDELQADLDAWMREYNEARPHQGRWCFGKTPMQTFLDAMPMTKEKMIAA